MEKLPQIHPSHIQEKKSIQRLEIALPKNLFILRAEDGGDYGVDRIIEVVKEGAVTNIRSHVQVKSSGKPQKKPGNFQFSVPISTLNYLLNSLNSIFIVYAEHEDQFYWDWVGTIAKERKAKEPASGTVERKTFSYNFSSKLDEHSILAIHERLITDTGNSRDTILNSPELGQKIKEINFADGYFACHGRGCCRDHCFKQTPAKEILGTIDSLCNSS